MYFRSSRMYLRSLSLNNNTKLKDHLDYSDEVHTLIANEQFDELFKYTNFNVYNLDHYSIFLRIIDSGNKKIIKHFISNISCHSYLLCNQYGFDLVFIERLLNLNCVKLYKYYIEKYQIDVERNYDGNYKHIHIACDIGSVEIVKFLIEKGVDLESMTQMCDKPIHLACKNGTLDIIKLLVEQGVDLESDTLWDSRKPIDLVFRYGKYDVIKYFLSLNIIMTQDNNFEKLMRHNTNLCTCDRIDICDIISKLRNP